MAPAREGLTVLTAEQVDDFKKVQVSREDLFILCDSHEALRARLAEVEQERDAAHALPALLDRAERYTVIEGMAAEIEDAANECIFCDGYGHNGADCTDIRCVALRKLRDLLVAFSERRT